jgi:exosortase
MRGNYRADDLQTIDGLKSHITKPMQSSSGRTSVFLWRLCLLYGLSIAVFWRPLQELAAIAWSDDRYTHLLLMPAIALGLIWLRRSGIFVRQEPCPRIGVPLLVLFTGLAFFSTSILWLNALCIALAWMAGFVWLVGLESFRRALVPLLFLLLMVPLPNSLMETAEIFLQRWSAEVTALLFNISGTPVFRDGLQFMLPGVTIEVARECSGIRSSIALMITTMVLSYLFLQSPWKRVALIMMAIPITIIKNAIRISTLSWLGVNVSMDFLNGDLHHRGGPVFALISFVLLLPTLLFLQKLEAKKPRREVVGPVSHDVISPLEKSC